MAVGKNIVGISSTKRCKRELFMMLQVWHSVIFKCSERSYFLSRVETYHTYRGKVNLIQDAEAYREKNQYIRNTK